VSGSPTPAAISINTDTAVAIRAYCKLPELFKPAKTAGLECAKETEQRQLHASDKKLLKT
jgi:hypothetical protein